MLLSRRNHKILCDVLLQHQPLSLDIVARVTPISPRIEISKMQAFLQPNMNSRQRAGDLARHESLAAQGRFVVEQDAVACIHAVRFAIVHGDPICINLRSAVWRARIKRRCLLLRYLLHFAKHLRRRCLIESRLLLQSQGFESPPKPQSSHRVRVRGVFGRFKGHRHMTLRGQIVDLVRLNLLDDPDEIRRIGQIAVVQFRRTSFSCGSWYK